MRVAPADRERLLALGWVAFGMRLPSSMPPGSGTWCCAGSNAEYTYTLRDLTGLPSWILFHEFPADSAAGEGFMNVGNALVMSPSLLTAQPDAAKEVTRHLVLVPDGLWFSRSDPSGLD